MDPCCVASVQFRLEESTMATAKKMAKKTARGRTQDRARVVASQDDEVRYVAKKTERSAPAVKRQ
jgi:hypothetical protein